MPGDLFGWFSESQPLNGEMLMVRISSSMDEDIKEPLLEQLLPGFASASLCYYPTVPRERERKREGGSGRERERSRRGRERESVRNTP